MCVCAWEADLKFASNTYDDKIHSGCRCRCLLFAPIVNVARRWSKKYGSRTSLEILCGFLSRIRRVVAVQPRSPPPNPLQMLIKIRENVVGEMFFRFGL